MGDNGGVGSPFWPLFMLELRTPRLLLRPPRDEDFNGVLEAIDEGIHTPESMPFSQPWTDAEPAARRLSAVQFFWAARANWSKDSWELHFAVFYEGRAVGIQSIFAKQFPIMREVSSGSWLSLPSQGQGFGKEMRAAVLQLAFEGLGASLARSGAFADNPASAGVSAALGYEENGRHREAPRGEPKEMVDYVLSREEWMRRRDALPRATVSGLETALPMFGLE